MSVVECDVKYYTQIKSVCVKSIATDNYAYIDFISLKSISNPKR